MRVYATPEQLAAYPGGSSVPAADAEAFLRTASRIVDRLLTGRVYDTDVDDMPTDVDDAQAMADATCAIVTELQATGHTAAGASLQWASVSIGSVSLSGRTASEGTVMVHGLPIPAAALIALSEVGALQVTVGGYGYRRPLVTS